MAWGSCRRLQTSVDEHQATVDRLGTTEDGQVVRLHQYQPYVDRLVTSVDTLQNSCSRLKLLVNYHKMLVNCHKMLADGLKTTVYVRKISVDRRKILVEGQDVRFDWLDGIFIRMEIMGWHSHLCSFIDP